MTFDQIKAAVKGHCNLSSDEADSRVGDSVNRHYRRITSLLGMDATRFVTRSASTSVGIRTVTFDEIEAIDRVLDTTDSEAIRLLPEVSVHEQRSRQPTSGAPCQWAFQNVGHASVTVLLDTIPQEVYSLQADGWTTLSDLQGDDTPSFPESFHDVLVWAVIAEELWRKEKPQLAVAYENKTEKLISELRFHLADTHTRDSRQADNRISTLASGAGGGSSVTVGGTNYTQSGLITFDRGAGAAPFAVAQPTAAMVANLDSDKLDGQHGSYYLNRANHTGTGSVTVAPGDITPVTTDRILGRDTAGTGAAEQLTVGGGLAFTGSGGLQTSALTGDVTKTLGGTALTIANDAVTYAKMQNVAAASRLLGRGSAGGAGDVQELTLGTTLALTGTALDVVFGVRQAVAVTPSGDFTTTSITNVNVTNAVISITTGAGATVMVLASVPARADSGSAYFDWAVDGVDDGTVQGACSTVATQTTTLIRFATGLSAAAHTFQLRVRSSGGDDVHLDMTSIAVGRMVAIEYR